MLLLDDDTCGVCVAAEVHETGNVCASDADGYLVTRVQGDRRRQLLRQRSARPLQAGFLAHHQ